MLTSELRLYREGLAAQRKQAAELRAEAGRQRERAGRQIQRCFELQQRWAAACTVGPEHLVTEEVNEGVADVAPAHAVVAFGSSAGGYGPLSLILADLPRSFRAAVVIAQHTGPSSVLPTLLQRSCHLPVVVAQHGETLRDGRVYVPPPGFHITIGGDKTIALTRRTSLPCPSVNSLFASLAASYGQHAIGVVLSGSRDDGAVGVSRLAEAGAGVIVQDPTTCEMSGMPEMALRTGRVDIVLPPAQIAEAIVSTLHARDANGSL